MTACHLCRGSRSAYPEAVIGRRRAYPVESLLTSGGETGYKRWQPTVQEVVVEKVLSSTKSVQVAPDLEMFCHVWRPDGEPRAAVLLLHGFGEHSGRYEALGTFLAGRGRLVVAPDHRGHGRSSGQRGHVLRFDQYLDDLDAFVAQAREEYPETSDWFILGHSLGGLIAIRYAMRNQARYQGLIVSNPLLGLSLKVPVIKALVGRALSRVWPALSMGNEIDPDHLARDPAVGQAYMADPLVHHRVSTRWFTEMVGALEDTNAQAVHRLQLPTLFLLSTGDRLTDHTASERLFNRLTTKRKTLKVYDGWYHEIFNEADKQRVFADVVEWMDDLLERQASAE